MEISQRPTRKSSQFSRFNEAMTFRSWKFQDLLEEEGLVEESWHRMIGYWAGMLDDKFSETEWQDEFDCQRDSRLLEDEFIHGGNNDVD